MKQTISKTDEGAVYTTKILILVALAILVSYLLMVNKSQSLISPPSLSESIKSPSDLDQAQDQLEVVNVDGVDTGLNQLNAEVGGY